MVRSVAYCSPLCFVFSGYTTASAPLRKGIFPVHPAQLLIPHIWLQVPLTVMLFPANSENCHQLSPYTHQNFQHLMILKFSIRAVSNLCICDYIHNIVNSVLISINCHHLMSKLIKCIAICFPNLPAPISNTFFSYCAPILY